MLKVDLEAFGRAANWSRLPEDVAAYQFHRTAEEVAFPGALLPAVAANGRVFWYAAANTPADWRQLSPLLVAYAGPTLTNFRGLPVTLNLEKAPERLLHAAGAGSVARLIPPAKGVVYVSRALHRLRTALAQRPVRQGHFQEAVSTILGRFDLCLAIGDRIGAEAALSLLSKHWRLDIINLHFLACRVFETFREWNALLKQSWFDDLCVVPKPAPVALSLLHALWHVHLEAFISDRPRLRTEYFHTCRVQALSLLPDLVLSDDPVVAIVRELEELPERQPHVAEVTRPSEQAGWAAWFDHIDEPDFKDAVDVARAGAEAWQISKDPEQLNTLADLLLRDPTSHLGVVRLREALPSLIVWIKRDNEFPRRTAEPLYQALFARFVLLEGRGAVEREAISELYETLLSLGVSARDYKQLSEDIAQLASEAPGRSTIDWLLDLAAITLRYPSRDVDARLVALNALLAALQSARPLLTTIHRAAYSVLAKMAGWADLPQEVLNREEAEALVTLSRKSIAIYTLTEGAAHQASEILQALVPGIRIDTVHDHVCTPRLENLSRMSDLMVVAWSSAKHAATDCIQRHRKGRPVAYAAGRGVSSLVRAVTEFSW